MAAKADHQLLFLGLLGSSVNDPMPADMLCRAPCFAWQVMAHKAQLDVATCQRQVAAFCSVTRLRKFRPSIESWTFLWLGHFGDKHACVGFFWGLSIQGGYNQIAAEMGSLPR